MNALKIGWVGLGNMGSVMASNLLQAGYELRVYNRSRNKEQSLIDAGAVAVSGVDELLVQSDIIFTMLSDDEAVKEIYNDRNGLLAGEVKGKLFIDMSTVAPQTALYLSARCEEKQADFLDAPVSGSVQPAAEGTLIIMAGGSQEIYQRALPLFGVLGKLSLHLGGPGAGCSAKVAINYLLAVNIQALAETVLFAESNGVSKENMLRIINEGACGNRLIQTKTPAVIQGAYPAAFALKYMVKDLKLARQSGLKAPLAAPLLDTFTGAMHNGLADEDLMAVIKYLDRLSDQIN